MQYISNFEQSSRALKAAEERLEWQHFLKHWAILLRALGHGTHSVMGLLIQPVQVLSRRRRARLFGLLAPLHPSSSPHPPLPPRSASRGTSCCSSS